MHSARILIVDDDPVLLEALPATLSLRLWRVEIDSTHSAVAALERVRDTHYDVVLSDVCMPHMDGLTLLRAIRQLAPRTSVGLMSGNADHAFIAEAMQSGASCFISKPFERDKLIVAVKELLKGSAANMRQQ